MTARLGIATTIGLSLALALLVVTGYLELLVAMCGLALCVLAAYRFPTVAVVIYLAAAGLLPMFWPTPPSYLGVRPEDAILAAMLCVLGVRLLYGPTLRRMNRLLLPMVLFGAWMAVEVGRNVGQYGISAPGEFRFRYLVLALPFFIGGSVSGTQALERMTRSMLVVCVGWVLVVPVLLALSSGSVSIGQRITSASMSVGLMVGLVHLVLARDALGLRRGLMWLAVGWGSAILALDAHRSVWILGAVLLVALPVFNVIPVDRVLRWSVPVLSGLVLVILVAVLAAPDASAYVMSRGAAAVRLEDTAAWRMSVQRANLELVRQAPWVGQGFGGYWGVFVARYDRTINVAPHSLYVQTLVKAGVVGLGLYFVLMLSVARTFVLAKPGARGLEVALIACGLPVLLALHVYYVVYPLEPYGLAFVGLELSAALDVLARRADGSLADVR